MEFEEKFKKIADFMRELAKFNESKKEMLKVKCLFCGKEEI